MKTDSEKGHLERGGCPVYIAERGGMYVRERERERYGLGEPEERERERKTRGACQGELE